jgi:hypothetical protein
MALATKPKNNSLKAKKRHAQHHKHDKHYLKHYWPYLPMLMIVAFGLFINTLWANFATLGLSTNYSSSSLLAATNANRVANNQTELSINDQLSAAAQAKAEDMVSRNYWAHIAPDGKTPWNFIDTAGYKYKSAGENLAYGFNSSDEAVAGWMNSPSHKENLLKPNYSNVGFGIAYSQNYQGKGPETIVVAEYGEPLAASSLPASNTFPDIQSSNVSPSTNSLTLQSQPVSRVAVLTSGKAAWSTLAISAIVGAAFMFMILKYGFKLKRMLVEGEEYVMHHPLFDIGIVAIIVIGIVMTRAAGVIN